MIPLDYGNPGDRIPVSLDNGQIKILTAGNVINSSEIQVHGDYVFSAGSPRTETIDRQIFKKRPRKGQSATQYDLAYLYAKDVVDDEIHPLVKTFYVYNFELDQLERNPSLRYDYRSSTREGGIQMASLGNTTDLPGSNIYSRFPCWGFNINANGSESFGVAKNNPQIFFDNVYTLEASGGTRGGEIYDNEIYLVSIYSKCAIVATYRSSDGVYSFSYPYNPFSQTYLIPSSFFSSFPCQVTASVDCSHASASFIVPAPIDLYQYHLRTYGYISGTSLKANQLTVNFSLSGDFAPTVTEVVNNQPTTLSFNSCEFYYTGDLFPGEPGSSQFGGTFKDPIPLVELTVHRKLYVEDHPGKKIIYLQRKNEPPIELYRISIIEYFNCSIISTKDYFEVFLGLGLRTELIYPFNPVGVWRGVVIRLATGETVPSVQIYDYDTPLPSFSHWLKSLWIYGLRNVAATTIYQNQSIAENRKLALTFPYWSSLPFAGLYLEYPSVFWEYIDNFTNIHFDEESSAIAYIEVEDWRDTDPIVPVSPAPAIILASYVFEDQSEYNNKSILSALLTGRFANLRIWVANKKVNNLGQEVYDDPIAYKPRLYAVELEGDSPADIINSHYLLGIIPYQQS